MEGVTGMMAWLGHVPGRCRGGVYGHADIDKPFFSYRGSSCEMEAATRFCNCMYVHVTRTENGSTPLPQPHTHRGHAQTQSARHGQAHASPAALAATGGGTPATILQWPPKPRCLKPREQFGLRSHWSAAWQAAK